MIHHRTLRPALSRRAARARNPRACPFFFWAALPRQREAGQDPGPRLLRFRLARGNFMWPAVSAPCDSWNGLSLLLVQVPPQQDLLSLLGMHLFFLD